MTDYEEQLSGELKHFADREKIHDLPEIYHYWSNNHLLPKIQSVGLRDLQDLFVQPIMRIASEREGRIRIASLGAGNCDFEIQLLRRLIGDGLHQIEFYCWELHREMLDRGSSLAHKLGVDSYVHFIEADVNHIEFVEKFDIVFANQSLHHFVELEHIFSAIRQTLPPWGYFVVSDMIGRNGHLLWPEAYEVVAHLWKFLPDRCKYNHQLARFEAVYENWDCSTEGFEGVRAQDILALLLEYFHFELFGSFGSFLDVFIGRAFGHNFDSANSFDRSFVEFAAELEERLLSERFLRPTHIIAWLRVLQPARYISFDTLTPQEALRSPSEKFPSPLDPIVGTPEI